MMASVKYQPTQIEDMKSGVFFKFEQTGGPKKIILLIDNDKEVVHTFARILERCGYATDVAKTGREALQKTLSKSYDAALIDVELSDIDGTELLLKLNNTCPKMVKIIITAKLDCSSKATDNGADAFLIKPTHPIHLLELLKEKLMQT